jgi:hypothetical protein
MAKPKRSKRTGRFLKTKSGNTVSVKERKAIAKRLRGIRRRQKARNKTR